MPASLAMSDIDRFFWGDAVAVLLIPGVLFMSAGLTVYFLSKKSKLSVATAGVLVVIGLWMIGSLVVDLWRIAK